mgnify:CR=1 FL=1
MRAHQRQYAVTSFSYLDKPSNLFDFRFNVIHCTVDENAMYFAVFGTFLNLIDIVIGIDDIYVDGDGRSLKKFNSSLGYQPLVCVAF